MGDAGLWGERDPALRKGRVIVSSAAKGGSRKSLVGC